MEEPTQSHSREVDGIKQLAKAASLRLRPLKTGENRTEPGPAVKFTPADDEPTSPVTPVGQAFSQPDMNVVILCVVGLAEKPGLQHMQEFLRGTLVKHRRFHSIMKPGGRFRAPEWCPVEVDLSRHVFEAPSEVGLADPSVDPAEHYTAKLATTHPLDPRYPLWQAHLLTHPPGARRPASLVLRIHHSLGDGTSLIALLIAATRQSGDARALPSIPGANPRPAAQKSDAPLVMRLLRALLRFLIIFWNSLVLIWRFVAMTAVVRDSETPVKARDGMQHCEKVLASSCEVALADVKAVARAVGGGATANDVLVACLGGGLNRYFKARETNDDPADVTADVDGLAARAQALSDRLASRLPSEALPTDSGEPDGELPSSSYSPSKQGDEKPAEEGGGETRKRWYVPKRLRVRALALVNIRKSPGVQELDAMMRGGSQARWGNEMGYVMLPLPVDQVRDPLVRVRMVRRETAMAKNSIEAWFTAWNGVQILNSFGPSAAVFATKRTIVQTSISLSNVVGPAEPVTLAGVPVTTLTPTVVGTSQGLIVHFVSYRGKVKFIACSIKEVVPDPEVLCQFCVDALEEMLERISFKKLA
ncbi:Wax Ester Synthase [Klebsormidium nitens]|uniref:Wax Ester Synthase n=1 Tax=Klebsormidium nitens TaxID=105231 RepID=A0A1Y1III5_KLENI|nr:Wax Ester Synthase [Klebsormidium nitens]|eukprot:GAQ88467.1 Wax Ester Synthase [Klebsormidium nitens]